MKNPTICGRNPTSQEKGVFFPPKFLMTFFSHQLRFSNFHTFISQKPQVIPYFWAKTTAKKCIFR